jgi:dTDP-glucose pyrophosphorylase
MPMLNEIITEDILTLFESMSLLNKTARKILFIVNQDKQFTGSLSDGDIRRWILNGGALDANVGQVANKDAYVIKHPYSIQKVKSDMELNDIDYVPILDANDEIIDILIYEQLFDENLKTTARRELEIPVIIMAGGKGTRLDPFTKILPKPLLPIGDKTTLEVIFDKFLIFGVTHFHLSVNYKSQIIKSYFNELNPSYKISYLDESKPLGTAGALSQLRGRSESSVLITNCDIIIDTDYVELLQHHLEHKNEITIVASLKKYKIPYGVCDVDSSGVLSGLREKPELNHLVNTGMYIITQRALEMIPRDEFYHMTNLVEKVQQCGGRVGLFPISDDSWADTGEWHEYENTLKRLAE